VTRWRDLALAEDGTLAQVAPDLQAAEPDIRRIDVVAVK
jgi:hypothetical protein